MNGDTPKCANEPQASVRGAMERLMKETDSEFIALALYDPEQREIRWRVAYGALSDRYKAIAIRMGKGIAGDVLSTGRSMLIHTFPEDVKDEPLEYPIMIIEKLVSCYATPVGDDRNVFGALMAGDRQGRVFAHGDREAVNRTARAVGKLFAPSYQESEIRRERTQPVRSPLMLYLKRHLSSPAAFAGAEILDQRITRISEPLQVEMTEWLDRLLETLARKDGERMMISVERKEGCWMTLEAQVPVRLEEPRAKLDWLISRVGELQGNVEMYNEPGQFSVRINLPVGLLAEDTPWVF
jgi:hypothetical protein